MRRGWLLIALQSACSVDGTLQGDEPAGTLTLLAPTVTSEHVDFAWRSEGVDAFNAVVIRDDIREAQTELSGATRSLRVDRRGAQKLSLQLQLCDKGWLRSACTQWSSTDVQL